jgi:hypothetical protein
MVLMLRDARNIQAEFDNRKKTPGRSAGRDLRFGYWADRVDMDNAARLACSTRGLRPTYEASAGGVSRAASGEIGMKAETK